jgi:uncharacterized surface anchored protein
MTAVSDENGAVVFEKIPYGKFTLEETKTPEGYLVNNKKVYGPVTIDANYVNSNEEIVVANTRNRFMFKKTDDNGNPVKGAVFGIYNENGDLVTRAWTDVNGTFQFEKIKNGKYIVREISTASDIYLLSHEAYELTVVAQEKNNYDPLHTFVNKKKHMSFIKVNTSGEPLANAEFSLINKTTGDVVETAVSGSDGKFAFEKFDYGTWIVRETKVPAGYLPMKDIELTVDDDWKEPAEIRCVDIPNTFAFRKTDNNGNPLEGVQFALEDGNGNVIERYTTGKDGIVRISGLAEGKYVIRETASISGYAKTTEVLIVEINEDYVVPSEMPVIINYPKIKTGVEINNPLIWIGIILLVMAAFGCYTVVSKKKKNKK